MPEGNEAVEWDFLTFVTAWSLYALPALLLVTGLFIVVNNRQRPTTDVKAIDFDGRRLIRIVALIHLSLGLHGIIRLVQELLTMRVMGVTESFANFIVEMLSAVVNPLLAIGFWRARRTARFGAIAWYVFLSAIAVLVIHWYWRYRVPVEVREWPNHLASKVMPLFLLVIMFLPRVRRAFVRDKSSSLPSDEHTIHESTPAQIRRWSFVSLVALLFLIVVVSNLAVDSADWIERSIAEWNQTEEP